MRWQTLLFIIEGSFLAELGLKWDITWSDLWILWKWHELCVVHNQRWAAQRVFLTCCTGKDQCKSQGEVFCCPLYTAHNVLLIKADGISFAASFFVMQNQFIVVWVSNRDQQRPHSEIPPYNKHERCCCNQYRIIDHTPYTLCVRSVITRWCLPTHLNVCVDLVILSCSYFTL